MKKIFFILLFLISVLVCIIFFSFYKKSTIAIIGAMDDEIAEVSANLSNKNIKQQSNFSIITGNLGKYKIVLSKAGVGKVNAASTTQYIIDKYKPIYIINIGIAGSLSPDLNAGDTIIAKKMVQHDFDVTAFGHPKGYMDNGIDPDKPTIYYSDKNLKNKFLNINSNLKEGTIATGDIFLTDSKLKESIKTEFNADAIDMESAAIAQTAMRNNIPVIVLRTISDGVNGTTKEYYQNKQNLARKSALTVISALKTDNK